jgi:hypothetical protein
MHFEHGAVGAGPAGTIPHTVVSGSFFVFEHREFLVYLTFCH